MWVDSLHNEIILFSIDGYNICNITYKGLFAYSGNGFRDLDYGVDIDGLGHSAGGAVVSDCITFGNQTLFGGGFHSVGSDTLRSKSIALWNGTVWDTFPKHCFPNTLDDRGGGICGFVKYNGKLWMYGGIDTVGNTITKNLVAYDGNTFIPCPAIPVSDNLPITKMIVYKNKLIATGNFDDYPTSPNMSRLAQFDGTSWSSVGNGVQGGLSAVQAMAVYKDTLYIAGAFPKSAGNAGNNIMKWDGNQLSDAGFGSFCGYGAIWSLLPFHNRLYAFGGFGCAADQKAFGMAYYENGIWTVSQDSVDNLITSAVVYNDAIYIGGGFKSINGDTTIQKFAKLMCPDFDITNGCVSGLKESSKKIEVIIFPNPTHDNIRVEFDQSTPLNNITILNPLGQEIYRLIKPVSQQETDVSYLPAGIYFLKMESKQGYGVSKFVKE